MRQRGEDTRYFDLAEAQVTSVDPIRYTCSVLFLETEQPADEVAFYSPYKSGSGPGADSSMPKEGDIVLCLQRGQSWGILAYKTLPRVEQEDEASEAPRHDFDAPRADYSGGRLPMSPGDWVRGTDAGNYLAFRADGTVEVVANELCATRWFPDEEAVKTFAATLQAEGYWGITQTYTIRDAAREERGATPTGTRAWLRTHAEGAPVLNLETGAVPDDEGIRLPGRRKRDESTPGSVCLRVLVFDQATANNFERLSIPPDPERARFLLRLDQEGNSQMLQAGQRTEACDGLTRHNTGRHVERLEGTRRIDAGGFQYSTPGGYSLSSDRGISMQTGGDFRIRCGRLLVEEVNGSRTVQGDYGVDAGGAVTLRGRGGLRLSTGADCAIVAGSQRADTVGGRYELDVFNRAAPENLGRDVAAWATTVHQGKARTVVKAGSWEVLVGPEHAPLARIKIFHDLQNPTQLGRIHIGFPRTGAGLTLAPDGSAQLTGRNAGIQIDASGRVQLGRTSATVGNVVTTLSHPVCYVTGAPIRGHSDVVVAAGAPLLPGPSGVASAGVVPPLRDLPDPARY